MRVWLAVYLLGVLYVRQTLQKSSDLLRVSIYYEALCPDSIRFITRKFFPAYQKIGANLKVDFVPYGKAMHQRENGKWVFTCQHGPNECWGNKAQACGLAENAGQDKDVDFVNCVMAYSNPGSENAVFQCAPKLGVPATEIIQCSESEKGDDLLAKEGNKTDAVEPPVGYVPTIIFNGKYDSQLQLQAEEDFLYTACSLLTKKPTLCPSEPEGFFF